MSVLNVSGVGFVVGSDVSEGAGAVDVGVDVDVGVGVVRNSSQATAHKHMKIKIAAITMRLRINFLIMFSLSRFSPSAFSAFIIPYNYIFVNIYN